MCTAVQRDSKGVRMLRMSNRPKPGVILPRRRGYEQWWWILTLGLLAGLFLYLFRHV